jgi:tagatose 1,6-diphosphate aldolase
VLCGRATWANAVPVFAKQGEKAFIEWMKTEGVKNIQNVNEKLKAATPWYEAYGAKSAAALA